MQIPLRVTYRNIDPSPALTARIEERAQDLERIYDRIIGCRVFIEELNRSHQKGRVFSVHIDLTVPGQELVVSRDASYDPTHEDPYLAVRDAFDAMTRRLEDFSERRRGEVKHH